jgi:hypothetical protein
MKASRYISAETTAMDRANTVASAPANSRTTPNSKVPSAAHHNRIRAAPPRRRASAASSAAATASTTKKRMTVGHATRSGSGDCTTRTATAEPTHAANAPHMTHAGTGRIRLTSRNVHSGCPSSIAVIRPTAARGGSPMVSVSTPSTNNMATEAKISMTSRSSGSRRRR